MTRMTVAVAMAGMVALASTANAQGGPPPGGMGRNGGPGAPRMQGMPGMGQDGSGRRDGPEGPPRGPRRDAASMLLSRTADLKLTDAQVTRLAGLARRAAEHRTAMRTSMDSAHNAMMKNRANQGTSNPGTAPQPPQENPAMRALMEKARQAQHDNLRDALAVLTPDQQASAFEMMLRGGEQGHPGARPAPGGPGMGGRGMGMRMDMGGMMDGSARQSPPPDQVPPASNLAPRRRPPVE